MATSLILKRHIEPISRQAFLTNPVVSDRLVISSNDQANGLTIHTATAVGVLVGSGAVWVDFYDGFVTTMSVFGQSTSSYAYELAEELGVEVVSEHEDDFSYHEFPVDVNTTTPDYKLGNWEGFIVSGLVFPYDRVNNSFYIHYQTECSTVEQFEQVINAIKEEYDL